MNDIFGGLLNTGASVFSGYTNSQVAKENAKAASSAAKAAQAQAQAQASQQSATTKWLIIGGGLLAAVVLGIFLLKRK